MKIFWRKQGRKLVSLTKKAYKKFKFSRTYYYCLDLTNKIKYGPSAPRFAERIWVNPKHCTKLLPGRAIKQLTGVTKRKASGRVIESTWPVKQALPITEIPKIKFCIEHWSKNVPWQDTGLFDYMEEFIKERGSIDGCYNIEDIKKRYYKLDQVFEQIKFEGRFKTRKEIKPGNYLEEDGVLMHIGPNGEPFFGRGGSHRFAMAYVLELIFPAQIGCVHVSAIPFLKCYRKNQLDDIPI